MDDPPESTSEDGDKFLLGSSSESLNQSQRRGKPNKKKYEEELDMLHHKIKTKESELKSLNQKTESEIGNGLKSMRSEKLACIDKLKKIDTDLKTITPEITKTKAALDRLQSTLHYKNEVKIDEAIRRLEWQLKVQNFKLSEEKKIVAEIDSLKRSKKSLTQFLALKKENDEMRDRQRRMREERDLYQKSVNNLRHKEDDLKKIVHSNKESINSLKKVINELYESKRKLHQEFKQQEKDFQGQKVEKKQQKRKDNFRRKEERRTTTMESFQKDIEEYGLQRIPYQDEINLCNTLINYLQKFPTNNELESPAGTPEDMPVSRVPGLGGLNYAQELEDGKYVLLKKEEDTEYQGFGRRTSKRRPSKKGRKQSVTKPVTHAPQIFSQFASLNLNAPSTVSEIPVSVEQLVARKKYYEDGGQLNMQPVFTPSIEEHHASDAGISSSDAGISATESAMCEMSRQASNTESTENPAETSYLVLDELVKLSNEEVTSETMSEISEDTLGRSNSDSTEHGQSECDNNSDQSGHSVDKKTDSHDGASEDRNEAMDPKSEFENYSKNGCHGNSKDGEDECESNGCIKPEDNYSYGTMINSSRDGHICNPVIDTEHIGDIPSASAGVVTMTQEVTVTFDEEGGPELFVQQVS